MLKNIYKKYRWAKKEAATSKALRDKARERLEYIFLNAVNWNSAHLQMHIDWSFRSSWKISSKSLRG